MAEIVAVLNQKGGVGKSTTAAALAGGLSNKGYKVLSVDLDPQGNLSYHMGSQKNEHTIMEVLLGSSIARETITNAGQGDIIVASSALAGADAVISETGKEYRLFEALEPVSASYDFIVLDTPPALGILSVNALTAANRVIIPAQADAFSLQGISQLAQTISAVRRYCNQSLVIDGILLTRYNSRSILSRDMTDLMRSVAEQLGTKIYRTVIRECVALREAQAVQQSIYGYSPKSNGAIDYMGVVDEFLER